MATLIERKLESVVKRSVKEAIEAQFMKFRAFLAPNISAREQREIERIYGRPARRVSRSYKISI